jgi:hypothetical protein
LPHGEQLEIGQQTKLGQKRRETVVGDLKQRGQIAPDRFDNRTPSFSSVISWAILLGSERMMLMSSHSSFTLFTAKQLEWHLRKTQALKLKTMRES